MGYADRCLTERDHVLVPAFLPEVLVWARHPFVGGQVVFQVGALDGEEDHRLVMVTATTATVAAHGGSSIRVGFDPHMAVKRDAETGWWCYR